jgi:hypothetical protein
MTERTTTIPVLTIATMSLRDAWIEWDQVERQFWSWSLHPESLTSEEVMPPTEQALDRAREFIEDARSKALPPPTSVAPTGDGGIVFERRADDHVETIEANADGSMEWRLLSTKGARTIERLILRAAQHNKT